MSALAIDRLVLDAGAVPSAALARLREQGFAVLDAAATGTLCGHAPAELDAALAPHWDHLATDEYLKDGGRYRRRRHACYVQDLARSELQSMPHRAHWQPTTYNALHGGMQRWFEPVEPVMAAQPGWQALITSIGALFAQVRAPQSARWFIEAHPFRIDTSDGVGRPTPEGAHRDGVDFVAVILVGRHGVRGGETRVFDADGPHGVRFTLEHRWSALLLDDPRVIHESTPIVPLDEALAGHRDTLVLTYRADGFQAPDQVR